LKLEHRELIFRNGSFGSLQQHVEAGACDLTSASESKTSVVRESRARATATQQLPWKMTSLGSRAWVLSSVTRKSSSLSSLPNGRKSRGSASSPRLQWQPQHLLRQPQPLLRRPKRLESALK
jgi:hypothetical protein